MQFIVKLWTPGLLGQMQLLSCCKNSMLSNCNSYGVISMRKCSRVSSCATTVVEGPVGPIPAQLGCLCSISLAMQCRWKTLHHCQPRPFHSNQRFIFVHTKKQQRLQAKHKHQITSLRFTSYISIHTWYFLHILKASDCSISCCSVAFTESLCFLFFPIRASNLSRLVSNNFISFEGNA